MPRQDHRAEDWLTPRESEILQFIVEARTNPEIADELGIDVHTVKTYAKRLGVKLNARNRVELAVKAIRLDLVDLNRLPDPTPRGMRPLAKREQEVVDLLAQGCQASEVAEKLGITKLTVLKMERDIRLKWGVTSREALLGIASTQPRAGTTRTSRRRPGAVPAE